jgi:hypothetical protein
VSYHSSHPSAETTLSWLPRDCEKAHASKEGSNRICCCSLLVGEDLSLERVGFGERDRDLVGGDLVVDLGHCLELGLNLFLVKGVKEDPHVLLPVKGHSGALASDGGGVALFNIN